MIKNYFKIAFRQLFKHKIYSVINIISLSIGIAACLLIGTMVINELDYDTNWDKTAEIYRIVRKDSVTGRKYAGSLMGLGDAIKSNFPGVNASSRIETGEEWFDLGIDKQPIKLDAMIAEPDVWDILNFDILEGNPKTFHEGYPNLIISEKIKNQFFPNSDPVGQLVQNISQYGGDEEYIITGVIKNIPTNTHLRSDVVVIKQYKNKVLTAEGYGVFGSQYVALKPNTDAGKLSKKVNDWYDGFVKNNADSYTFQPIKDIYLKSDFAEGQTIKGSLREIYIFMGIALILLFIGCINFVNLSTARALGRMKETGVRKVLGASKKALVQQFLTESLLYFGLSFILSLALFRIGLPVLKDFLGYDLPITIITNLTFLISTLGFVFLVSILTGLYPALLLSNPQPARILKNKITVNKDSGFIRKSLVAVQFVVAISLLVAATVVFKQLNYIDHKDLGYNKDNLLKLDFNQWGSKANAFKQEISEISGVENSSVTSWVPSNAGGNMSRLTKDPNNPGRPINIWYIDADRDFISTLNVQLIKGRYLDRSSDIPNLEAAGNDWEKIDAIQSQQNVLITEHTAEVLGITELNKHNDIINATPVGIVANFHNQSLRNPLLPTVIRTMNTERGNMLIKVDPKNRTEIVGKIQKTYASFYPGKIFGFSWVDKDLAKQYEKDRKLESLFQLFSGLIIFLSCMGLFGLVTYVIESRIKEIGIRKVLGESVFRITKILLLEFLKIIVLAGILATPIMWILMNKWLQNYSYQIELKWWFFVGATSFAILIAIVTVGSKTFKAASANPIKSLRTE